MVPMHTLWACVLQLCTIQLCTTPLCTIQVCTTPLCTILLCTIQLCTIQLQVVQVYSSHQRSVPVCTAQACLIQLRSILPHFIPVPPAWGCVPEPPPVLPVPPQRLAWPRLLSGRISAPPQQQLQPQLPVQCRQQGRAALRGLRSGFCQPAVQDGAGLCRKPPLAKEAATRPRLALLQPPPCSAGGCDPWPAACLWPNCSTMGMCLAERMCLA